MLLYSVGVFWVIGGQHDVAPCDESCKDVTSKMQQVEDGMTNFDVRFIKFHTYFHKNWIRTGALSHQLWHLTPIKNGTSLP